MIDHKNDTSVTTTLLRGQKIKQLRTVFCELGIYFRCIIKVNLQRNKVNKTSILRYYKLAKLNTFQCYFSCYEWYDLIEARVWIETFNKIQFTKDVAIR